MTLMEFPVTDDRDFDLEGFQGGKTVQYEHGFTSPVSEGDKVTLVVYEDGIDEVKARCTAVVQKVAKGGSAIELLAA